MKKLLLTSFIRGLGSAAALASIPLLTKAWQVGHRHTSRAATSAWQGAKDEACALKHGWRERRQVRRTLRRARRRQTA